MENNKNEAKEKITFENVKETVDKILSTAFLGLIAVVLIFVVCVMIYSICTGNLLKEIHKLFDSDGDLFETVKIESMNTGNINIVVFKPTGVLYFKKGTNGMETVVDENGNPLTLEKFDELIDLMETE